MLPRSQSNPSGRENFGVRPKKKPAPPRPPQPKLDNSHFQSFRSTTEIKSYNQRSMSISNPVGISQRGNGSSDLISFDSPPKTNLFPKTVTTQQSEQDEFMYRIGASIFYIKSPLKNSTAATNTKANHPFSPPRPTQFPTNKINNSQTTYNSTVTTSAATAFSNHSKPPTILKQQQQHHGGSVSSNNSSSSGSTTNYNANNTNTNNNIWNNNNNAQQPQTQTQPRYSNIPLAWDEPPKKTAPSAPPTIIKPPTAPKPTIIRPAPTRTIADLAIIGGTVRKNYYDEPPAEESEDDDSFDDDEAADSFNVPPEPSEPPPPPPQELHSELNAWVQDSTTADKYYENLQESEQYQPVEGERAYAIALYDYIPECEGDLALQAGDLVYLTKKIDESWLCGEIGQSEGMFPSNFVNVVVPLPIEEENETTVPVENPTAAAITTAAEVSAPLPTPSQPQTIAKHFYANVLYEFKAETDNDLSIEPGEVVTIWGRVDENWLYGSKDRKQGQFPAAFISPLPSDLPIIPME